jgi:hypothetical protein
MHLSSPDRQTAREGNTLGYFHSTHRYLSQTKVIQAESTREHITPPEIFQQKSSSKESHHLM